MSNNIFVDTAVLGSASYELGLQSRPYSVNHLFGPLDDELQPADFHRAEIYWIKRSELNSPVGSDAGATSGERENRVGELRQGREILEESVNRDVTKLFFQFHSLIVPYNAPWDKARSIHRANSARPGLYIPIVGISTSW